MEPAIETIGLTKRYGPFVAVNKLSLKVERNSIHGFLDPGGAGKTTTMKVLVGLLKPDQGASSEHVHGQGYDFPAVEGLVAEWGYTAHIARRGVD